MILLALFFFGISTAYSQTITGVNITQPVKTTIFLNLGDPATAFTASAVGAAAIAYEWYVDGELQIGQTSANFSFPTPTAEGVYSVYAAAVNAATGSNSARSIEITIIVTVPPPPSTWAANKYVGTFHRNNETGERIIYSGHSGAWSVAIEDPTGQGSFIRIDDGSTDATLTNRLNTMYVNDNWVDPEPFKVTGTNPTVSGNGNILFRVGMASVNNTGAPRYGRIVVTSTAPGSPHYLSLRQGEDADYVSTTYAGDNPKWSPYNVGKYGSSPILYGNGGFVDYPSKAGYFYQWSYGPSPSTPLPYPPQGSSLSPTWVNDASGTTASFIGVCPAGYKEPTGGLTGGTHEQASLAPTGTGTGSAWGYYADGYFDRRMIVTSVNTPPNTNIANTAVSTGNDEVAYIGSVVYNLSTNASLFLPASGFRNNTNGVLDNAGVAGYNWSRSIAGTTGAYYLYAHGGGVGVINNPKSVGFNVRCVYDAMPTPPSNWADNKYVGTFHRNSETGERVIYSGHTGAWSVAIEDPTGQGSFIRIDDGSSDATLYSRLKDMYVNDNWVDPEPYKVTGTNTTVTGNGNILFRVGMASQNTPTATAAPRYGRIVVTSTAPGSPHYIYVRQGEQADNISTETTPINHAAVKWSPYNLGNVDDATNYPDSIVNYPTKTGYFYQWSNGISPAPVPYPPQGTVSGWVHNDSGTSPAITCPTGYKLPTGNMDGTSESESLVYDATTNSSLSSSNGVWGYYADGFFDRRRIETNTVVSKNNDSVAYIGRLLLNPTTNASLFLPASGNRSNMTGGLVQEGITGFYWSSNAHNTTEAYRWGIAGSGVGTLNIAKSVGHPVRCILDACTSISSATISGGSTPIRVGSSTPLSLASTLPSGATAPFSYQWQWNLGIGWVDIPDATSVPFNAVAPIEGTIQYRLIVTNCGGSATSNVVSVTGTGFESYISAMKTYVGAFWKYNQTGERLIRLERPGNDNYDGAWSATVISGDSWIELDKTMTSDGNVGWRTDVSPNEANVADMNQTSPTNNDNIYRINGTGSSSIFGTMDAGAGNQQIYFRIGLKSNNPSSTVPRYGVVLLTYNNHSKSQRIFIRQGEAPDFVPGKNTTKKWSPYNVGDYDNPTVYGSYAIPGFVGYPTQAGYFYQWNTDNGTTSPPYHPINPPGSGPAGWVSDFTGAYGLADLCQSSLVPTSGAYGTDMAAFNDVNIVWGYYADGFFDRRAVNTSSINGEMNSTGTAVSLNTSNYSDLKNMFVAYAGVLFYSTVNNSSLFFPAAGVRLGASNNGRVSFPGGNSSYWSQIERNVSPYITAYYWNVPNAGAAQADYQSSFTNKGYGMSVRCVNN